MRIDIGDPLDPCHPVGPGRLEDAIGLVLDPARDLRVGRTSVGRVVLEAAVVGWVVRRRDHDPVRQPAPAVFGPVGRDDGVGERRGRGEAIEGIDPHIDAVRDEDPKCSARRGLGERVGVAPQEQRPRVPAREPVPTDRLGDGEDVGFVERATERRAAVAGRPERDPLRRVAGVGRRVVVGADERVDIDQ